MAYAAEFALECDAVGVVGCGWDFVELVCWLVVGLWKSFFGGTARSLVIKSRFMWIRNSGLAS